MVAIGITTGSSALFSRLVDIAVRSATTPCKLVAVAEEIIVVEVRKVAF